MKNEVVIISPELKAGAGGLADYALRVVEEWGPSVSVRFIGPESISKLSTTLPASGGKVLLHYSAYGFDRLGFPRGLLRALVEWKHQSNGRLVLMFHEIWTFWPLLNKNYLVQKFHRSEIRKLISVADAVFTSTPSQAEHLLKLVPTGAVEVLPVGSNIHPDALNEPRQNGLAVLFGLQSSRIRTLRKIGGNLAITKLITIGQGTKADEEERMLLSALRLTKGFEQRGPLPEAEISELLSRATFGLFAQDKLSLHKSGTFMAYAAHGLNIIAPYADAMAPEPVCWLTHPRELLAGIAPNELKARADNLRAWQERTSSWAEIAHRLAVALQLDLFA